MSKFTSPTPFLQGIMRRSVARTCIFITLLAAGGLLTPGCGCRNMDDDDDAAVPANTNTATAAAVKGSWVVTLNPGTVPIDVPLVLKSDSDGKLTGTLAGAPIQNAAIKGSGPDSTLEFTTGGLTVPGATGELNVAGPLNWSGVMRDGMLDGRVIGPDGRSDRWTARRKA